MILGLFISTYLYQHIYPLHNSWSRNFQMGTQWEKSGLSLLQETPMGTYFNLLVPTYLSSTNSWSRNFEYRRSLAYPYCRRLPWERTGRRCSFLLAWEIGGKGLGHWWETHLFPLISHKIRFSEASKIMSKMTEAATNDDEVEVILGPDLTPTRGGLLQQLGQGCPGPYAVVKEN